MMPPPPIIVPSGRVDEQDVRQQRRLQRRLQKASALPAPRILRGVMSESQMADCFAYAAKMPTESGWVNYGNAHEALFLHHGYAAKSDGIWKTFPQAHPGTFAKLLSDVRKQADEWKLCPLSEELSVRCIEFHTYTAGGGLTDLGHTDQGSILTFSVQLSPPGEAARGGRFSTTDATGETVHELEQGDAILFCSEQVHNVSTLQSGTRNSLVVELWRGETNKRDRFS